ncbi:MAG: ykuD [Firmicutes bacterium]|nr:ykuD [Bacillota bacterium]
MRIQKKFFQVIFLIIVFSSLLVSFCLAAPKPSTSQETTKTPDKIQNSEAKPSISQETTKVPDKIQNSEAKPSIFQEFAEAYDQIIKSEPLLIIVDKSEFKLHLFKEGTIIKSYDVAIGKNPGQKQRVGDMTTPTGEFTVDEIINSSYWTHDFNDGNGEIEGAYGPWFISLETGWNGIGIHGTHNPNSIRTMASEGCIRMNNDEVAELKELISTGTKVVIAS